MSINSNNTKLKINGLLFKAYLEDSDISYETKDQQLPFVPTSFVNDSMAVRVMQKAKFTFNVFSETRFECIANWRNLQNLLGAIKPSYRYVDDQLKFEMSNVTGFVNVEFRGLPERNVVKLHLTSFSYNMNKELGYLHVPEDAMSTSAQKFYKNEAEKYIPISYKISLDGKVLLPFEQTAKLLNKKSSASGTIDIQEILSTVGGDEAYQAAVLNVASTLSGQDPLSLSPSGFTALLAEAKDLKDKGIVDQNGRFQETDGANSGLTQDQRRERYQKGVANMRDTADKTKA